MDGAVPTYVGIVGVLGPVASAIVYSQRYQIDLAGLEKLRPFDINRYAKVCLALVADELIRPKTS